MTAPLLEVADLSVEFPLRRQRLQALAPQRELDAQVGDFQKRRRHFNLGFSVSLSQSPRRLTDSASARSVTAGKVRIHHSPENR